MFNDLNTIFDLLKVVFVLIFVISLAYFTTKYVSKFYGNTFGKSNIKIINRLSLGLDINVIILKVEDMVYIICKSNKSLILLDKMSYESWEELEEKNKNNVENTYKTPLEKVFKISKKKGDGK